MSYSFPLAQYLFPFHFHQKISSASKKTFAVITMFVQKSYGLNELSNRSVFRKFSTSFIAGPTGKETIVGEM